MCGCGLFPCPHSSTSAPVGIPLYPCNRGTNQPMGYHQFQMTQYGACCVFCGATK